MSISDTFYVLQEVVIEVWDWDAGSDDEKIGYVTIPLQSLAGEEDRVQDWYEIGTNTGQPVWGEDGSKAIIHVIMERNIELADIGISMQNVLVDPDEIRVLDCTKESWESATRGLMFDVENHSDYPVLIKGFWVILSSLHGHAWYMAHPMACFLFRQGSPHMKDM